MECLTSSSDFGKEGFDMTICNTFQGISWFKIVTIGHLSFLFITDQGIDSGIIRDISDEDLCEMGLTLKLGPKKKLLSFLQNLGKSTSTPVSVSFASVYSKAQISLFLHHFRNNQ